MVRNSGAGCTQDRAAILDGRWKRGDRMPSRRGLARQHGLSRGTVIAAFEQLHGEGYTSTTIGGGTYVASGLPDQSMAVTQSSRAIELRSQPSLYRRAHCRQSKTCESYPPRIPWEGVPDLRAGGRSVPRELVGSCWREGFAARAPIFIRPGNAAEGDCEICRRRARCCCEAGQVIITSGAQQALDLVARILLDPGDAVWMEDPGYPGARFTLRASGANVVPAPVDENTELGREHGALIVEDEYDR